MRGQILQQITQMHAHPHFNLITDAVIAKETMPGAFQDTNLTKNTIISIQSSIRFLMRETFFSSVLE